MKYDLSTVPANLHTERMLQRLIEASRPATTTQLFGLPVVSDTIDNAASSIVARAQLGKRTVVNFINAHCVNMLKSDRDYRRALEKSDRILPDGSGLRLASRFAQRSFGDNLNGTDLFPEICRHAEAAGQSIFLLGGAPGIARDAAETMGAMFTQLNVAGTHDGYFTAAEEARVVEQINASGADILFVGFGVPLQEKWIDRVKDQLEATVILGVGGLFDYYSGSIPRAPKAVRSIGCEWAWRLAMEPRRLAYRYLVGNAVFMAHAFVHAAQVRGIVDRMADATKRTIDLVGAACALLLLLPLFLLVGAAIRYEDRGPVFFRQLRIGEDGRSFEMLKFRSMFIDAEARRTVLLEQSERDGICFKMRNDPRITRTGRFIRRFSLDELPQLINVLRGDMALVGPRPALASEVQAYSNGALKRLRGKPGITCIWQVSGRAEISFTRQLAMDVAYLQRRSVLTDLAIMLRTIPAVISGKGAY